LFGEDFCGRSVRKRNGRVLFLATRGMAHYG
jgi:hypothetical protein